MAKIKQKTVWLAVDGTEHETEFEADTWDRYVMIRSILQDADLDWGSIRVNPDTIASLLADRLFVEHITQYQSTEP